MKQAGIKLTWPGFVVGLFFYEWVTGWTRPGEFEPPSFLCKEEKKEANRKAFSHLIFWLVISQDQSALSLPNSFIKWGETYLCLFLIAVPLIGDLFYIYFWRLCLKYDAREFFFLFFCPPHWCNMRDSDIQIIYSVHHSSQQKCHFLEC